MDNAFQKDCLEILASKVEKGDISRRRFTQMAAMLLAGAPALLRSTGSYAQAKELVLVNWGGDAMTAYDKAYGQPFTKDPW
jgi:putative spermidine/putrescine transport system substrate-binding protein